MQVRVPLRYVTIRQIKPHYSEDIKREIEQSLDRGRVTIAVAPPGTGKSFACVELSVELLSGVSPALERLRAQPEIVYYLEPTHTALSSAAEKIDTVFRSMEGLSRFVSKPVAFILRGAFYSCINPELRDYFSEIIYETFRNMMPEELRQKVTPLAWGLQVRRALEESESIEQLLRLADDVLQHYSYYSKLESFYSFLCSVCPYNVTSIRVGKEHVVDLVSELIGMVHAQNLDIVDSGRESAEHLADELLRWLERKGARPGTERVCPYRLLLKFAMAETEYRKLLRARRALFFMTHAMLFNPTVLDVLEHRFFLPTATGRPVRHVIVIDEFDNILLNPPAVRLPIHIAPRIDRVTADTVRRVAGKYTRATGLDALCRLIDLGRELYSRLAESMYGIGDEAERARRAARELARWIREKLSTSERELTLGELVKKADYFLLAWRRNMLRKMRERRGSIDIDHVVVYIVCNEVVRFFSWLLKSRIATLAEDKLAIVSSYQLGVYGPRQSVTVRPASLPYSRGQLKVAFFNVGDLTLYLYDLAARVTLTSTYPYLALAKIGITATFSEEMINSLVAQVLPEDVVRNIQASLSSGTELNVHYHGLVFYRIAVWCTALNYERAVHIIERQEIYGTDATYTREVVAADVLPDAPRKIKLREEETTKQFPPNVRGMMRRSVDVLLNTIHELYYIAKRELQKREVKVFIFTGTQSQMVELGVAALRLSMWARPVRHGVTDIRIVFQGAGDDYVQFRAEITDARGRSMKMHVTMSYARSRYSRGIDLEEYDMAVMLSPPITPPDDMLSIELGASIPGAFVGRHVIQSVVTTCQCLFRIIRRAYYDKPKVIAVDISLVAPKYMTLYPRWFREHLELSRRTPIVTFIESPDELPDRYST